MHSVKYSLETTGFTVNRGLFFLNMLAMSHDLNLNYSCKKSIYDNVTHMAWEKKRSFCIVSRGSPLHAEKTNLNSLICFVLNDNINSLTTHNQTKTSFVAHSPFLRDWLCSQLTTMMIKSVEISVSVVNSPPKNKDKYKLKNVVFKEKCCLVCKKTGFDNDKKCYQCVCRLRRHKRIPF